MIIKVWQFQNFCDDDNVMSSSLETHQFLSFYSSSSSSSVSCFFSPSGVLPLHVAHRMAWFIFDGTWVQNGSPIKGHEYRWYTTFVPNFQWKMLFAKQLSLLVGKNWVHWVHIDEPISLYCKTQAILFVCFAMTVM